MHRLIPYGSLDNDLIDTNYDTLLSWQRDKTPSFELDILNDALGHPVDSADAGTHWSAASLPATYTFDLDITTATEGYDITEIKSYAGWNQNGSCLANQKYELLVDYIDADPTFVSLGVFEYSPFVSSDSAETASTKMTVKKLNDSDIATGVASLRFVLMDHGQVNIDTTDGSVYFEIDVRGVVG